MSAFEYLVKKYNLDAKPVVEIANVGRIDIVRWIREMDLKLGAEIGVDRAEFSKLICQNNPQVKLYGVDFWRMYDGYTEHYTQNLMDKIKQEAKERMVPFRRQYVFVEKPSAEALKDFEDESLDFVYIDANHEAPFVGQDIEGWAKKVKKGGIVMGHDYIRPKGIKYAVIEAVNDFAKENNYPLFILGTSNKVPGQIRDWSRSWAITK